MLLFNISFEFKIMFIIGDKLVRAIELVKLLSIEKSVRAAILLVTKLKLPNLAERFNTILEVITNYIIYMTQNTCNSTFFTFMDSQPLLFLQERLLKEATETVHKETTEKKETLPKTGVNTSKTFTSPETSKTPEPVNEIKSAEKLSSPSFVKKKKIEEPAKVAKVSEPKETTNLDNNGVVKKNSGEVKVVTNPFAKKSSNNQEKSSFLDSFKKMKKNESPSNK